ncbi:hypothetical protein BCD72_000739 [Clostridium butyricum]|uniref:Uncharacterized protein n=1 Tax=Clostridium butyricum TaxID=1492 RepID=A0A6N3HTJ1_CLOBU|nr:hypothetical protein [Clostridium butyricum]MBA8971931.1 hypothetical protein [Clostridium butyricum]NOW36204.1 hypothetical protein [Clostridium butyricum]
MHIIDNNMIMILNLNMLVNNTKDILEGKYEKSSSCI